MATPNFAMPLCPVLRSVWQSACLMRGSARNSLVEAKLKVVLEAIEDADGDYVTGIFDAEISEHLNQKVDIE